MQIKYISWMPAALIMLMIFLFSAKPAEVSGKSSLAISKVVLSAYEQIVDYVPDTAEAELLDRIDHIVRKTAHFIEYALLAAAIALHCRVIKTKVSYGLLLSILIAGLYACTDEYHQTFVPGRSGQLSDVLLDTIGAAAGAICFSLLGILVRHWKLRKSR